MVLLTLFHLYPIQICWKKVTFLRFNCFIGPVLFTWFTLFFSILETYSTDGHRGFAFDHRSITPKFVTLTALSCIDNSWRSTTLSPPKKLTSSTGPGRSWIAGPAGISRLGPNSEPRGNNRSFPETRERDRVPVKKIGSLDSIFGLVNSKYFFEITNHNQLVSNIKYLANFIKQYWTNFRYQKLADFLVCLPPSVRV